MNNEIKRIIIDEEHYTESNYPFTIKPNLSTLGSIIEISIQGPLITFAPDDSIRDLLGLNKTTIYEEYNLSPNPVDILSFDMTFLECNIAQVMIFKGKRSGIIHNFTMTVDPGYKNVEFVRWCSTNFHYDDPVRLVYNGFAFCFEEARLSTTIGSDIEHNNFSGQVSTIMRVISNKDGDLLSQFDNINENEIPVLERLADLPPQIKSTPHQKMLINNHTDPNKGKIKRYLYLEDIL